MWSGRSATRRVVHGLSIIAALSISKKNRNFHEIAFKGRDIRKNSQKCSGESERRIKDAISETPSNASSLYASSSNHENQFLHTFCIWRVCQNCVNRISHPFTENMCEKFYRRYRNKKYSLSR